VHGQRHAPADLLFVKKKYIVLIGWTPELVCVLEKREVTVHAECTMIRLQFGM
jgi:hypothetical protein